MIYRLKCKCGREFKYSTLEEPKRMFNKKGDLEYVWLCKAGCGEPVRAKATHTK